MSATVALDTDVPAVLLRTDANVLHHGTLGVIRSLGARGVPVHAVIEHPWAPVGRSRHLHRGWPWWTDPGDPGEVLDGLRRIADALDRPAVLLTTDDAGAALLAEHGEQLRERFLLPRVVPDLPRRLADKAALPSLCAEFGMACPRTERVDDPHRLRALAAEFGLPLVVKRGRTTLVRTRADLEALAAGIAAHPALVQEYLPPAGPDDGPQDWIVHAYLDGDGEAVFVGTGVKERSYPAHTGLTSLGRVEPWPALAAAATGFLRRAGYRGVVDLDLRVDPRDGEPRLLDANPRFGAQFRMFRGAAGVDVAVAAHLDLTGRTVPADPPTPRRFVVEPYDPVAALTHLHRGELGIRGWIDSLRGIDEPAWFAADDPLPAALMTARTAARTVRRGIAGTARATRRARSAGSPTVREDLEMSARTSDDHADVVIIGAGPYGLSLGAHLAGAGVRVRHFGGVMAAWKAMPKGMFLKSQGSASSLADPAGRHTLEAYCRRTRTPYAHSGLPVELDTFVAYGEWFARELVGEVEDRRVVRVDRDADGFRVELADGGTVTAASVVVAVGLTGGAVLPAELADLPAGTVSHAGDWTEFTELSGRRVVVVGAGQSALQSAALAHEAGADARVLARGDHVRWNGDPLPEQRPPWRRLREPEAPLGSGWATWFYSNRPDLYRRLPAGVRLTRARTALGPAGACWLRPRVEGVVPILTGHRIASAAHDGDEVRLDVRDGAGRIRVLRADHVVAGTGYRTDLARMDFLAPGLRAALATLGGSPAVTADYRSSVPGLYFCGPTVAPSVGPVARFAYGATHAAPAVARSLLRARSRTATAVGG